MILLEEPMQSRICVVVLLVYILTACSPTPKVMGTLRGHVTIGPLVPAIQEGWPEPTPDPQVYAARQIVIFKANGKTEVARADINTQGNYEISLPVGTYVVDINRIGIDHSKGLPKEVEILANEVTVLDVDIDTGIR